MSTTRFLPIILIFFLGLLVYSNTFLCPFELDDFNGIVNNFSIRYLHQLQNIWNVLPRRFLLYLSIAVNYHFNGLNVGGYHFFNLGIHIACAILVWWFTLLTLSTPGFNGQAITRHAPLIALFAGLIFVAHPIQTEAVTYIIQRAAALAALFYLASLCLYVKSRLLLDSDDNTSRNNHFLGRIYYGFSLATAIAAMFTKETAITLPLMIFFYEISFFKKDAVNGGLAKKIYAGYAAPFWLTLLIIPLVMWLTETSPSRMQHLYLEPGISPIHYLLTQLRVMVTYMRLLIVPVHQNLDYDYPLYKSFFELPVFLSFLLVMTVLFCAVRLFSTYRLLFFSIFWIFLTLLPESSFLPIKDIIFEHRLYLPLVGYSILLSAGMYYIFERTHLRAMVYVLSAIVLCYSLLAYQRNKIWRDGLTLWNDAIQKSPHKARPYLYHGLAYLTRGDINGALGDYTTAIKINPSYADAYFNRGIAYDRQGNFDLALSDYNRAIALDPTDADAYNNRAATNYQLKKYSQARQDVDVIKKLRGSVNPKLMDLIKNASNNGA